MPQFERYIFWSFDWKRFGKEKQKEEEWHDRYKRPHTNNWKQLFGPTIMIYPDTSIKTKHAYGNLKTKNLLEEQEAKIQYGTSDFALQE